MISFFSEHEVTYQRDDFMYMLDDIPESVMVRNAMNGGYFRVNEGRDKGKIIDTLLKECLNGPSDNGSGWFGSTLRWLEINSMVSTNKEGWYNMLLYMKERLIKKYPYLIRESKMYKCYQDLYPCKAYDLNPNKIKKY